MSPCFASPFQAIDVLVGLHALALEIADRRIEAHHNTALKQNPAGFLKAIQSGISSRLCLQIGVPSIFDSSGV